MNSTLTLPDPTTDLDLLLPDNDKQQWIDRPLADMRKQRVVTVGQQRALIALIFAPVTLGGIFAACDFSAGGLTEGLLIIGGIIAVMAILSAADWLDDLAIRRRERTRDGARAARSHRSENSGSDHVQWAPRVIADQGQVVVQLCRFVPMFKCEQWTDFQICCSNNQRYRIHPVWQQRFAADDDAAINELRTRLEPIAQAAEAASADALADYRRDHQLATERVAEQQQLAEQAAQRALIAAR